MDETVPAAENAGMDRCQNFRVAHDPIGALQSTRPDAQPAVHLRALAVFRSPAETNNRPAVRTRNRFFLPRQSLRPDRSRPCDFHLRVAILLRRTIVLIHKSDRRARW